MLYDSIFWYFILQEVYDLCLDVVGDGEIGLEHFIDLLVVLDEGFQILCHELEHPTHLLGEVALLVQCT